MKNQDTVGYDELVKALAKPGLDVINDLTEGKAHLLHMAVGISGEVGELVIAFDHGAHLFNVLDTENVIEELGDIEFYMEGYRQELMWNREDVVDPCALVVPYGDAITTAVIAASQILDLTKKYAIYGKVLDAVAVAEWFRALESAMNSIRVAIGIDRLMTIRHNTSKLRTRYHSGSYSDQHAQERKDKKEGE